MNDTGVNNKSGGMLLKPAKLKDEDVKTFEKNTKEYKESISPFHIELEGQTERLNTKTKAQELIDVDNAKKFNPICQVNAKISLNEKLALYALIKSKGCDGLTGFLKMLAKAKEVQITI